MSQLNNPLANTHADSAAYDILYVQFIFHFNLTEDYFECHEVLEELWLETGRDPLYQGLLQVAVALHHHHNDNFNGAIKLYQQAIDKLQHFPDVVLGIDLAEVLARSRVLHAKLLDAKGQFVPFENFKIMVLDPALQAAVDDWALQAELHGEGASHDD